MQSMHSCASSENQDFIMKFYKLWGLPPIFSGGLGTLHSFCPPKLLGVGTFSKKGGKLGVGIFRKSGGGCA